MKKWICFLSGGLVAIALYFASIGIYTRLADDPIIFFISLLIALLIVTGEGVIFVKMKLFDGFSLMTVILVYYMGIVLLTTFGPTFIDRSISYQIAFYAVDEEQIDIETLEQAFTKEIFEKRVHDAVETGFIEERGGAISRPERQE